MKKIRTPLFAFLILAIVSIACGGVSLPAVPAGADVPTNATEARAFYTKVVTQEIGDSAYFKKYEASYSQGYQKIVEQNSVTQQCWKNLDGLVKDAMAGRFSAIDPTTNHPGSEVNQGIAIKAYAPVESYPSGVDCKALNEKLFNEVGSWRANNADMAGINFDRAAVRNKLYHDDIIKDMTLDLMTVVASEASAKGVPYFKKFIFPTYNLEADSHNKQLCDLYTKWADDPSKKEDGYLKPSEWNPVYETCVLRGLAAHEYMNRVIMVPEVAKAFDSGKDVSPLAPAKP